MIEFIDGDPDRTFLFFEIEGVNLRRMPVDRDGGQTFDSSEIVQVPPVSALVDTEIGIKGHQTSRNDAARLKRGVLHLSGPASRLANALCSRENKDIPNPINRIRDVVWMFRLVGSRKG